MISLLNIAAFTLTVMVLILILPYIKLLSYKSGQRGSFLKIGSYKKTLYISLKNVFYVRDESIGLNLNTFVLFIKFYICFFSLILVLGDIFLGKFNILSLIFILGVTPILVSVISIINKSTRYNRDLFYKLNRNSAISLNQALITFAIICTSFCLVNGSTDLSSISLMTIVISKGPLVTISVFMLLLIYIYNFSLMYDEDLFKDCNVIERKASHIFPIRYLLHDLISSLTLMSCVLFLVFVLLDGVYLPGYVTEHLSNDYLSLVRAAMLIVKMIFIILIIYSFKKIIARQKFDQIRVNSSLFITPITICSFMVIIYELL